MRRSLLLAGVIAILLASPAVAQEEEQRRCGAREALLTSLAPQAQGIDDAGSLVEVFTAPGGQWVVTEQKPAEDRLCLKFSGESIFKVAAGLPVPEEMAPIFENNGAESSSENCGSHQQVVEGLDTMPVVYFIAGFGGSTPPAVIELLIGPEGEFHFARTFADGTKPTCIVSRGSYMEHPWQVPAGQEG